MNNIKNNILTIILAILILGAIAFIIKRGNVTAPSFKPVALTSEEKKSFQDKVGQLQSQINNFDKNTLPQDRLDAYLALSQAQLKLGQYPQALGSVDKVANDNSGNPRVWEQYGRIYWAENKYDLAKQNMQKSLAMNGENVQLWKDYIEVLHESAGSNDDINSTYAQAVNATGSNIDIIKDYAKFLEGTGNKDGAIFYWGKAMEVDPQHAADYQNEVKRIKAS